MKAVLLTLAAFFILSNSRGEAPEPSTPLEPTTTTKAELNQEGRLIFTDVDGRPVELREGQDCGMIIFYDKTAPNPHPTYKIFLQKERSITLTESFADFAKVLDRIPAASKIYLFEYCSGGTHFGLPQKYWKQLDAAFKKRKLQQADPGYIICTCRG